MRAILGLLLLVTGCGVGWDDVPGAEVHPVAAPEMLVEWTDAVRVATNSWGSGLEELGCDRPFMLTTDQGHSISLVDPEDWTHGHSVVGYTSYSSPAQDGSIEVISDFGQEVDFQRTLLHELGHALGLEHADTGIMRIDGQRLAHLRAEDFADAACALGCGPCPE